MEWKLAEAKNRLSEVLDRATREGPQKINRRNEVFYVVPAAQFQKATGKWPTFKDWLLNGPSLEGVDLERDRSPMRDIDL